MARIQTQSHNNLLLLLGKNGYANAPQY